jgi:hypothetical protein
MDAERQETLAGVVCDILEKQAFVFAELVDKRELAKPASACVRAQVRFSGTKNGTLSFALPTPLLSIFAANALGVEPDDDAAISGGEDAVKEALNVVCGHILTELEGVQVTFNLSSPVIESLPPKAWDALLNDPESIPFVIEDFPVLLLLK